MHPFRNLQSQAFVHDFELVLQITVNQNTVSNKMKNKVKKKTTLVEQFQNPIEKSRNGGKIDTANTEIHDHVHSWYRKKVAFLN